MSLVFSNLLLKNSFNGSGDHVEEAIDTLGEVNKLPMLSDQ